MPTIGYVKVTIVQVYSMRHTEWPKKYFATVTINDVTEKTEEATLAVMSNAWNQELTFTISGSSKLKIQIFQQHRFHDDSLIGTCEGDLEDLLMQSLNGNIEQEFRSSVISQTKVSLAFRVEFHEDPAYQTAIMKAMIQRTKLGSLRLAQPRAQRLLSGSSQLVDEAVSPDLVEAWIPLLQKLEIFANLANMITEVHPYAKAAYSVISLAYKVVHDQIQRDMNIQCLVNTMDDIYSFVKEAEPLHHIESQRQVMACLAQQTVECGYFISAYCSETFLARAVRHSVNPTDLAVIEYGQKFSDLKAALLAHATIQTEIKVLRIFETAERIETKIDLGDIPYANGVRFRSSKRCLSGTRDSIVNKIIEWLDNPEPGNRRILMLKGSSGTGKSTIAHSIASHYHDLKRLGSSIFVNLPDDPKTVARLPALIFPTIARDLADLDPHFRNALWNIIESDKALRKALDPTDQYENFILGPSTTLTMSGPIVIVIDALDKCSQSSSLRDLLEVLFKRAQELPTNVRIFLTVQQDSPILGHSDQNTVEMIQVDNFDWSTKCDLLRFLNYKLLANLPVDQYKQFSNPMLLELVDLSHGSFQWIDWVSDALCSRSPRNLVARYQDIVDPLRQPQNPVPLAEDHLFLEEIQRLASLRGPSFLAEFRLLMGTLLTSYTPLSLMEFLRFADFLDDNNKHTNMRNPSIGHVFESLLMHSKSCYMPLVPHHPSFYDFLCDTSRSKEFCIDISSHHGSMALACLRVLNKQLQFNICHLPSSFCANADIPNLSDCIERNLTPELSYASRFWMKHIQSCAIYLHGGLQKLLVQLQKFFESCFFFWLEVLSLTGEVDASILELQDIMTWFQSSALQLCEEEPSALSILHTVENLVKDALFFVKTFKDAIVISAPHIYVSGPFLWQEQRRLQFPPPFQTILNDVTTPCFVEREATRETLTLSPVTSIAVSPDSQIILITKDWGDSQIWKNATKDWRTLSNTSSQTPVTSIALSPDSQNNLVPNDWGGSQSAARDWRALPAQTYEPCPAIPFSTLTEHGRAAVVSSGSKVWSVDVLTGQLLWETSFKHRSKEIHHRALRLDGKEIAISSGTNGSTISVYKTISGYLSFGPIQVTFRNQGQMRNIALSSLGSYVAAGSTKGGIWLWNTKTRDREVLSHVDKDLRCVMSMAFCKSEKRFITGHTGCIYVWNIQSGQIVHYFDAAQFEPFQRLNYLTISPNGKYLAWGTYITSTQKAAVYFVDLELGATDTLPPLQTDSNVNCLVFSNDGLMLAAGCHRGEAYTWPFAGGEQVRSVESVLDQDGWVLGPNNELLFWLSPSRLELMKDTGEIVLPESHLGGLWAKFLLATSAKPGF